METDRVSFGGNQFELYFEADDFDAFIKKLRKRRIEYVHPVKEHSWGQRVVRFYDPDRHIIEVGERMESVCRRFIAGGLMPEQTATRMDVPLDYVNRLIK
ncbi:MAG: hypothetical protein KH436_07575 [Firmicutes bacterium]|nr:hypothetical protein [Bacillota bacterium]